MNSVETHPLPLAAAVALLWIPRRWLRVGPAVGRRKRALAAHSWTHAPQDGTVLSARHEFSKLRNYVDLLRAAAALLVLLGGYGMPAALTATAPAGRGPVLAVIAGTLLIAVLIQMIRCERRGWMLNAPVFFIAGLMISAVQPQVPGLCAFALAWALIPVNPRATGFLTVQAIVFAAIGCLLGGIAPLTLCVAALGFLPVAVSLLARRPLMVLSSRRGSRT